MKQSWQALKARIEPLTPLLVLIGLVALRVGAGLHSARPATPVLWASVLAAGGLLLLVVLAARFDALLRFLVRRRGQMVANAVLMVLAFATVMAVLSYFADRYNKRVDWTKTKRFSLSPQTVKILKGLEKRKKEVVIAAFYRSGGSEFQRIRNLLEGYGDVTPRVKVEIYDPYKSPDKVRKWEVKAESTVIFKCGKRREEVSMGDEKEFTTAILKVTRDTKKKIYFLQGHGEHTYDSFEAEGYSGVKKMLEDLLYEVKPLDLLRRKKGDVPKDCDVLVIAGAQRPLLPQEMKAVKDYLKRGGKLLLMLEPDPAPTFEEILKDYGLKTDTGIVIEPELYTGDPEKIIAVQQSFRFHDITRPFEKARSERVMFDGVRPLKKADKVPEGWQVSEVIESSSNSWQETKWRGVARVGPDEDEERGPFLLAAAVTPSVTGDKKKTRLVITADSDFASNELGRAGLTIGGLFAIPFLNPALFANCVNWLAQEEELIEIPPKDEAPTNYFLSRGQQVWVFSWSIMDLPLLCLLVGAFVWWIRR